jgi:hypothetical protein
MNLRNTKFLATESGLHISPCYGILALVATKTILEFKKEITFLPTGNG